MANLRQQLPPLDALVMFEAAARYASFTAAADELHVTQAAVSRQIRLLEENLEVRLFVRTRRGVELSHHGRELQRTVSPMLKQLASTAIGIRSASPERLTVAMDQSIAGLWLTSRLPEFQRRHPSVNLRLVVSDDETDCLKEEIDVAIIHGDGNWPSYQVRLLFGDEIFPVCSPAYLKAHQPIKSPSDLVMHTLLDHEDEHWAWVNWPRWLHLNDVEVAPEQRRLLVNNYSVLVQATCDGQGVALGWRQLVENLLEDGQLVCPLPGVTKTEFGYHVLLRDEPHSENVNAFVTWMFDSDDQTVDPSSHFS